MFQYDMLARSLATGNGFRWYDTADLALIAPYLHLDPTSLKLDPRGIITTFRAPLYPAFLSLIYYFNGINDDRFFAARLAQTILGALLAPLTYYASLNLSTRTFPNEGTEDIKRTRTHRKISRLAAWMVAVYPTLLIYPLALATENLFFLLILASMLSLLKLAQATNKTESRSATLYSLLSGLLLGLAALTRSVILPCAFLAILWIWLSLKQPPKAILASLVLALTIAPWIIRNSLVEHKLTGIETSMGYNLYVGYHPLSSGTFIFGPSLDLLSNLDDQTRDQLGRVKALGFIIRDPWRFTYLALNRLGYFFDLELRGFIYFYVNNYLGLIPDPILILILLLLGVPFAILSLSAALGAGFLPPRPETKLLALLLIGYLLPHVFILSEERFHLTLIPFFAICAANQWVYGFNTLKSRGSPVIFIAGIIAALLIVNWFFELTRDGPILAQILGPYGNQLYLPY